MKEFRLRAFALKKITMLSATSPTRKKKAQTQMGNDSQSKKKVSGQKTKPRQRF